MPKDSLSRGIVPCEAHCARSLKFLVDQARLRDLKDSKTRKWFFAKLSSPASKSILIDIDSFAPIPSGPHDQSLSKGMKGFLDALELEAICRKFLLKN